MATVLLIDDSDIVRNTTARMLTRLKYSVIGFSDGSLAREFMKGPEAKNIRLIVCDVRMPVMDGIEFYKWISQHKPYLLTSFIFHSSSDDMLNADEAVKNVPRLDKFTDMQKFSAVIAEHYFKPEKSEQQTALPQT